MADSVLRRLAKPVRLLSDRVVVMSTLGVNHRIHAGFPRLARTVDANAARVTIERMPTRSEIAARISSHREAVSRELTVLEEAGIVRKLARRGLLILDVPRLERMAQEAMR